MSDTPLRPSWKREGGFTLVELMVAMMILAMLALAVLHGLLNTRAIASDARNRLVATNIASSEVSRVRASEYAGVQTGRWTTTVGGQTFTVYRDVRDETRPGTGPQDPDARVSCQRADPSYTEVFKRVSLRVTWPGQGRNGDVRTDTLLDAGQGANQGDVIALSLRDGQDRAASSVSVSSRGRTALSDSDGCLRLPFSGNLATLTAETGYVFDNDLRTRDVNVTPGQPGYAVLGVDRPVTVTMTDTATAFPVPAVVPLTVSAATNTDPQATRRVTGTWPRTTPALFPHASGYRAWLGSCSAADPVNDAVRLEGLTPGEPVTIDRAALSDRGGVQVRITTRPNQNITANHSADPGCPGGENLVVGRSNASGRLEITMPYGDHWRLRAGSGAWTSRFAMRPVPLAQRPAAPVELRLS